MTKEVFDEEKSKYAFKNPIKCFNGCNNYKDTYEIYNGFANKFFWCAIINFLIAVLSPPYIVFGFWLSIIGITLCISALIFKLCAWATSINMKIIKLLKTVLFFQTLYNFYRTGWTLIIFILFVK